MTQEPTGAGVRAPASAGSADRAHLGRGRFGIAAEIDGDGMAARRQQARRRRTDAATRAGHQDRAIGVHADTATDERRRLGVVPALRRIRRRSAVAS